MKRNIKRMAVIVSFALAFAALCGCGEDGNVTTDQLEEYTDLGEDLETTEADFFEEETTVADDAGEDNVDYGEYTDKVNELMSEGLADQFVLVKIDEDDSPELVASDSTGSFDHENAFIFTVKNGEVVELASVIAGVDGAHLDCAEGKNLIHVSGAVAGMRDVFSRITDGELEEVFTAEASSMDENANYSVNGSSVKENEYYEQINEFVKSYGSMKRIEYDGLYEISYSYSDGYGGFEVGSSESYQ